MPMKALYKHKKNGDIFAIEIGTTTFVANQFERKYIGIDISEEYCLTARNRLDSIMF
jgi:DNA modification methylase